MAIQTIPPELFESRFNCPRCGAFSHQQWIDLEVEVKNGQYKVHVNFGDGAGYIRSDGSTLRPGGINRRAETEWRASFCVSCEQSSVWRGSRLVHPVESSVPSAHPDMPADVAELYEEARSVLPISRRASAALARATLERLLRSLDDDSKGERLDELIARLSGRVTAPLWKLLTALRVVGNDTLHGSGGEDLVVLYLEGDASKVAEPFFGAINSVVEELITQPAAAEALYSMLPQAKRADAERKALRATGA